MVQTERDPRKSLSAKQQSILRFIRDFLRDKDYPPSIRDIQDGCDISSTSVVDYNLKALERLGYIRRDREVSRAIELLSGARRTAHRAGRRPDRRRPADPGAGRRHLGPGASSKTRSRSRTR